MSNIDQSTPTVFVMIAYHRPPQAITGDREYDSAPALIQGKHRVLDATILDRNRAPSLFPLPGADDAGTGFHWPHRF
jgi:hypothetical protein